MNRSGERFVNYERYMAPLSLGLVLGLLKTGGLVVLVSMLLVAGSGCVKSSVVPGYHYYSFVTKYDKTFDKFVRKAEYSYGPYKWRNVNGNGGFGGLTKFYNLNVRWEAVDGLKHEAHIPVPELMASLETEDHRKRVPGLYIGKPTPELHLKIERGNRLLLIYTIEKMVDEGPSSSGGRRVGVREVHYEVFNKIYREPQGGE